MFKVFVYILWFSILFSANINEPLANRVANNLISERSNRNDISIESYELIKEGDIDLFYIYSLHPS